MIIATDKAGRGVGRTERPSCATILIADDSPLYRKLLVCAKNGREALRLFAEHLPELVITDWTMPDISGIELCQRIRAEFKDHYPYIVLLTSNSQKEEIIEGLAAGADDYLTKPFHSGELQARVSVGLRIVALHQEIQAKNRQLEELALTDPLTGLPNRRAVDLWASRQLTSARRHRFPLWVAMADLDYFKKVNDTYGHEAGDLVLKRFAEVLKKNTRQSNICGRLGGEEFLVVLTHVDKQQAWIALERIRLALEMESFSAGAGEFHVTASFGIARLHDGSKCTLGALLSEADAALYTAKSRGRNRIEFLEE
jgi:diguanylate cyclase (GGDEF)-like protein